LDVRTSRLLGFTGGLLLVLSPLLVYASLPLVGFIAALAGFTSILFFLRLLSRVYDEPLIWSYAKLSALAFIGLLAVARLGGVDEALKAPYLLGVTLIPSLVNAVTFASLIQLLALLAFYTLLLLGSFYLLKAFTLTSIKSRERRLALVGYTALVLAALASTLLTPILSGFLLVIVMIYGRLREP